MLESSQNILFIFHILHRKPNRQQSDGFSQFGIHQGQQGQLPFGGVGGGQFYQQGGPALFPGQGINGFGHGGFPNYNNFNPALQQGQGFSPIHSQGIGAFGNNFGGFPSHNLNLQNGILVGPGGPTGKSVAIKFKLNYSIIKRTNFINMYKYKL